MPGTAGTSSEAGGRTCVLLRVWLPDRPGALGAVASRIGAVRGDIVGIDVLERSTGIAIDEFGVVLPSPELIPLVVREVEEVDGTRVEHVALVDHFPDPRLDALSSVAAVCEASDAAALHGALTAYAGSACRADWAVLVGGTSVLSAWGDTPEEAYLVALAGGAGHSPAVAAGQSGPDDLATAPLTGRGAILLVGRAGNAFRARERAQLVVLARIAGLLWGQLDAAAGAGTAAPVTPFRRAGTDAPMLAASASAG